MNALVEAITAFAATNIDDIVILVLLFSRVGLHFRVVHIVGGQYLGIAALVLVSLLAYPGRTLLPESWIGLLGLLPISLGITQLRDQLDSVLRSTAAAEPPPEPEITGLRMAGMFGVASITIANGSDNVGVYMPMFASHNPLELMIIVAEFALLTGMWCLLGWWLTRAPGLATLLQRYGDAILPAVLIGIGSLILYDSHTLANPPLAVLTLVCLAVMAIALARQLHGLLDEAAIAGASQR